MKATKSHWIIPAVMAAVTGSALHFLFGLVSGFTPVGVIAAVNESVWEHMKLAFWPTLVFGALASRQYSFREWAFPLAAGITAALFAIPLGFYFIMGAFGVESLAVDIVLFFAAVFLCFMVLCRMLRKDYTNLAVLGLAVLLLWAAFFIVFTFLPPRLPLFYDTEGAFYGIPQ